MRNQKTHSNERMEHEDTRPTRPTDRDVIIVDGKEFTRTQQTSLSRKGRFDLPKKPGFLRRWVSTSSHAPHSIQELVNLGYNHAIDENGKQFASLKGGIENGQEFRLVPMEISEEMNAKIERDKKTKKSQESTEGMKNVDIGFGSSTYIGKEEQKFVTKK